MTDATPPAKTRDNCEPIARLELLIDGERVNRHVRVPFNYASAVRPGANLALRTDPEGTRAMIVEWDRLS